jgi:hypothetical protein
MKYCRYCSYCILGDVYYCTCHDKVLKRVDKPTSCEDFILSDLGDVETGKPYKPRNPKTELNQISLQMKGE